MCWWENESVKLVFVVQSLFFSNRCYQYFPEQVYVLTTNVNHHWWSFHWRSSQDLFLKCGQFQRSFDLESGWVCIACKCLSLRSHGRIRESGRCRQVFRTFDTCTSSSFVAMGGRLPMSCRQHLLLSNIYILPLRKAVQYPLAKMAHVEVMHRSLTGLNNNRGLSWVRRVESAYLLSEFIF